MICPRVIFKLRQAKKSECFDKHIKCLIYMTEKLKLILKSNSPVVLLLQLENQLVDYQASLNMTPNTYKDNSNESLDSRFTSKYVRKYQLSL